MEKNTEYQDVNTAEGLINWLRRSNQQHFLSELPLSPDVNSVASRFCSRCALARRHYIYLRATSRPSQAINYASKPLEQFCPAVFCYKCQECDSKSFASLLMAKDMPHLTIFPEDFGGIRTEHTPPAVSYYLNQAWRAENSEARSAAASMYRAALEHILFDQGFKNGMLNSKIRELETAIASKSGPSWSAELDSELLHLLKTIGNGSIHPNNGNIEAQKALDEELLRVIGAIISALLEIIYELPSKKAEIKGRLLNAAALLKK